MAGIQGKKLAFRCSRTVNWLSIAVNCGQTPNLARAAPACRIMETPLIITSPEVGVTSPRIILKVVVFPAPFGPIFC